MYSHSALDLDMLLISYVLAYIIKKHANMRSEFGGGVDGMMIV